jgi:hypothetical protein
MLYRPFLLWTGPHEGPGEAMRPRTANGGPRGEVPSREPLLRASDRVEIEALLTQSLTPEVKCVIRGQSGPGSSFLENHWNKRSLRLAQSPSAETASFVDTAAHVRPRLPGSGETIGSNRKQWPGRRMSTRRSPLLFQIRMNRSCVHPRRIRVRQQWRTNVEFLHFSCRKYR